MGAFEGIPESFSFEHLMREEDLDAFANLSGDFNPLHMDEAYARTTRFGGRIAHGMLTSSFLSRLVGMHLPGRKALYLSQTLSFVNPVRIGERIIIEGRVTDRSESTRIMTLSTLVRGSSGDIKVEGVAKVMVLG